KIFIWGRGAALVMEASKRLGTFDGRPIFGDGDALHDATAARGADVSHARVAGLDPYFTATQRGHNRLREIVATVLAAAFAARNHEHAWCMLERDSLDVRELHLLAARFTQLEAHRKQLGNNGKEPRRLFLTTSSLRDIFVQLDGSHLHS